MENLVDGLQRQMNRVREILPGYKAIGAPGLIGVIMIKTAIKQAEQAISDGDTIAMMKAYKELEGIKD